LPRRRDRVLVGGDDAASPSDALDLRRSQLGDGAAVISLGSGLLTDTGGVEGNDRRPLLELRTYPPLQLAEARDEQQPRPRHQPAGSTVRPRSADDGGVRPCPLV